MECLEKQVVSVVVLGRNVQKLVADTLFGSKGIKDLKCCAKAVEAGAEICRRCGDAYFNHGRVPPSVSESDQCRP